jgi:hypothetical protein
MSRGDVPHVLFGAVYELHVQQEWRQKWESLQWRKAKEDRSEQELLVMVVQQLKRVEHNKQKMLSKWVIIDICTFSVLFQV